jgi:hypothetical protein
MTTKHRRKNRLPPFVPLFKSTMATLAWRTMRPGARLLYIELRGRLRNDYLNNGNVFLSDRDAAKAIGADPGSIVRWYAENEHYGFLRQTSAGFLGAGGRGIAAHYRFTDVPHGTHPPTRDFEKWDGELFSYRRRRKQNPVRKIHTPRVAGAHIRKDSEGASVRTQDAHIGEAPRCAQDPHITRTASPTAKLRLIQGSSMARAPVQAGDAGSTPVPEANRRESLTAYVLSVVNAELDRGIGRLDARTEVARTLWPKASKWAHASHNMESMAK